MRVFEKVNTIEEVEQLCPNFRALHPQFIKLIESVQPNQLRDLDPNERKERAYRLIQACEQYLSSINQAARNNPSSQIILLLQAQAVDLFFDTSPPQQTTQR